MLPSREREKAFTDRQDQIRDLTSDLKRTGWKAWRKPASFALTIAGAAWTLKTGDPLGALLAATGAVAGSIGGDRNEGCYGSIPPKRFFSHFSAWV